MEHGHESLKLECILAVTDIFTKDPSLVIKAYNSGFNFDELIEAVKDADPEMALASIEFWHQFIITS